MVKLVKITIPPNAVAKVTQVQKLVSITSFKVMTINTQMNATVDVYQCEFVFPVMSTGPRSPYRYYRDFIYKNNGKVHNEAVNQRKYQPSPKDTDVEIGLTLSW